MDKDPAVSVGDFELNDITGGGVMLGGAWINSTGSLPAAAFTKNGLFVDFSSLADGVTSYQFWAVCVDGTYTKAVKMELNKGASAFEVRAIEAKHITSVDLLFNFDTGGNGGTVATSHVADGYGIFEINLNMTAD